MIKMDTRITVGQMLNADMDELNQLLESDSGVWDCWWCHDKELPFLSVGMVATLKKMAAMPLVTEHMQVRFNHSYDVIDKYAKKYVDKLHIELTNEEHKYTLKYLDDEKDFYLLSKTDLVTKKEDFVVYGDEWWNVENYLSGRYLYHREEE